MANIVLLPLELIRAIVNFLDLSDVCNWALSHPLMNSKLLDNTNFCKDLVENLIPNSKEAHLARLGDISFRRALVNTFQRRKAYAGCRPYSVYAIESVSDYIYNDGTLCYLTSKSLIYIEGVNTSGEPIILDLNLVFPRDQASYRLVRCHSGLLIVRVRTPRGRKLAVFHVDRIQNRKAKPTLMFTAASNRTELVRNDLDYVVVGTFRDVQHGVGSAWAFAVYPLDPHRLPPYQLGHIGNFGTSEIGSNIVVDILDRHLWIISSQITHDPEGSDPISYYGGCYVPLSPVRHENESSITASGSTSGPQPTACPQPTYFRLHRRRQREGPIHDGWTTLSLSHSEAKVEPLSKIVRDIASIDETSEVVRESSPFCQELKALPTPYIITETRAEWLPSIPSPFRSFYTTTFFPLSPDFKLFATALKVGEEHLSPLERLVKITEAPDSEEYVETMLSDIQNHPNDNFLTTNPWWFKQSLEDSDDSRTVPVETYLGIRHWWPEYFSSPRNLHGTILDYRAELLATIDYKKFKLSQVLHRTFEPSSNTGMDVVVDNTSNEPLLRLRTVASPETAFFPPRNVQFRRELLEQFLYLPSSPKPKISSDSRAVIIGWKETQRASGKLVIISFDPLSKYWGESPNHHVMNMSLSLDRRSQSPKTSEASYSLRTQFHSTSAIPAASQPSKKRRSEQEEYQIEELDLESFEDAAYIDEDPDLDGYQPIMGDRRNINIDCPPELLFGKESKRKRSETPDYTGEKYDIGLETLGLRAP